jgi:hypothetical protein
LISCLWKSKANQPWAFFTTGRREGEIAGWPPFLGSVLPAVAA